MYSQRRQWHPTPVLLPGKSHGWRSLIGYSPWGRKELDMTEWLYFHFLFVYSWHLFLISSASIRSLPFLFFIEPMLAWNTPLLSLIFLKRSQVFPILLFSSISLHWSLRKAFLSLLAIPRNSAFKWLYLSFSPLLFAFLLFTGICKASSDSHFAFFAFLFLGDGFWSLSPVQCHECPSIVHQALYQI